MNDKKISKWLAELSAQGIELWASGDRLGYRAPRERLTPALVAKIKKHKPDLLHFLSSHIPLSHGQQALWFIYLNAPQSAAYNVTLSLRIHSPLDVGALQEVCQKLVERHPLLRTTISMSHELPMGTITNTHQIVLQQIAAQGWDEEQLYQSVLEMSQRPFNLEQGPVMRMALFTRSLTDHLLFIGLPHLLSDAWSLWILFEELLLLYSSKTEGLPPPKQTFADYVRWERALLLKEEKKLADYWRNALIKGNRELPVLTLPTDFPRPASISYEGASHQFRVNQELTTQLRRLAATERVTLFSTLLAAFQVLLYRYSGQEEILVGTPAAGGRSQAEFAQLVGHFVNSIVLRADLSDNPTFQTFLSQVQQEVTSALAHQDYPFPLLVKALEATRDPSHAPIFQSLFVLHKQRGAEDPISRLEAGQTVNWHDLLISAFETPQLEGHLDLVLDVIDTGTELVGRLKYRTDLFKAETIQRMANHFQTLLEGIVRAPRQKVAALPLLPPNERQQILVGWNETTRPAPLYPTVPEWVSAQAAQTPDAVAVEFVSTNQEKVHLTYQALDERANQLANYLIKQGVGAEDLVGLSVSRELSMVVGLLGILKAGAAYVPLGPEYPKERLQFMTRDAQIALILTIEAWGAELADLTGNERRLIRLDTEWEMIARESKANPNRAIAPENLAYCIYTSGSTGWPKGVLVEHTGLSNLAQAQIRAFEVQAGSRVLQMASLNFDASISEIVMALCSGATLVLADSEALMPGPALTHLLRFANISHVTLVPSSLALLDPDTLPGLQTLIVAGEACSADLAARWSKGRRFFNAYGPTETTVCATIADCSEMEGVVSPPIGRPIDNTQIYILDHNLQPIPPLVAGELHVGGIGLARGYLNRPELTQERFIPHPFSEGNAKLYKTGDLARYLPDGTIEFLGRIDHQVKIRGFRVELGEIEAQLTNHPGVREGVVIASEEKNGQLLAYWIAQPGATITSQELRQTLASSLPDYMVPAFVTRLEKMPLTPNGKLDRHALPSPNARSEGYLPPRNPTEQRLAQIWETLLDVRPIGIRDNFFDLGGHSLLSVRLMGRIQQEFGHDLQMATLLQGTTIERLATIIDHHEATIKPIQSLSGGKSWSPLVPIQPQGNRPPFFCVHPIGGRVFSYMNLAHHLGNDQPFYGLEARGLHEHLEAETPIETIEEMATEYIEAIQTIQPTGPYYLGGWSFGGIVAFEMAQQLQQRGAEVAQLALIESYAYAEEEWHKQLVAQSDEATLRAHFVRDLGHSIGKSLNFDTVLMPPADSLQSGSKQIKQTKEVKPDLDSQQIQRFWQVFKANWQAAARYRPQPYSGPITFFWADQEESDSSKGWGKFVTQAESHTIAGDHYSIMRDPGTQSLACQILRSINTKTRGIQ